MDKYPTCDNLFKAFTREKRVPNPLLPDEKGTTFRYLLRNYIFKF
jgi:hypothetical protein